MNIILSKQILVPLTWRTITSSDQQTWPFTDKGSIEQRYKNLRDQIKGARVYRFFFNKNEGKPYCYIGESGEFARRCREYIRAYSSERELQKPEDKSVELYKQALKKLRKDAELRVANKILQADRDRTLVQLQFIDFEEYVFNNVSISPNDLSDSFKRRAIENFAVIDSESTGINILNIGKDMNTNWLKKFVKKNAEKWNATKK
ncbi:MAG: hypothetical protein WAN35_01520 [Terracidiphilus sp.]